MSNVQDLMSSNNFPLVVVAVTFIVLGLAFLGVSAVVSLRSRGNDEE